MATALRTAGRAIAALVALIAVATVAAALLLGAISRGWQRERVTALVASAIGDAVGAEVRIASLEGALYDGFVARGVVATVPGQRPLSIDALTLRFALAPLFRERRLAIESALAEGLDIEVEQRAEAWRIAGLADPVGGPDADEEPPALRVLDIEQLTVRDGHLLLRLEDGTTTIDARVELGAEAVRWADGESTALPASADVRVALAPSLVDGRAIERGALQLRLANGTVQIERAAIGGAFGDVELSGDAALAGNGLPPLFTRARADATFRALDLAAFADVNSDAAELASRLDGTAHVEFTPDAAATPGVGQLRVDAALRAPRVGDLDIETLRARGSFHTGSLAFSLDEFFAAGAAGEVRGRATGTGERIDAAELRADLLLERLPAAWQGDAGLRGRAKIALDASGSLDDPRGSLVVDATGLQRGDSAIGSLTVRANAPGKQALRIDALSFESPGLTIRTTEAATLRFETGDAPVLVIDTLGVSYPGGQMHARGRVTTSAFANFEIDLDERDLAATAAAFGLDVPVAGAVTGSISADGALARPALRGSFAASPIAFQDQRVDRIEVSVAPDAQRLAVTARLLDGGAERLRVAAHASSEALWSAPTTLLERSDTDVRIRADALDVAWIAGALGLEQGAFAGRLDIDASARGASRTPLVTGSLRLAEGRVAVGDLDEPIGPIEAELRLENSAVRIESIRIPGGDGAIEVSGVLHLLGTELGESDVRVAIAGFELPKGSPATGRLDGALHLQGVWPAVVLDGRIALADAHIDIARRQDPVWREIRIHGLPGEESTAENAAPAAEGGFPAVLLPARAEIAVAIPPDTRVQGNGADLRITGEIRILKRAGKEPLYLGGIQVVEGRYKFQNRRFDIERGIVTLTGTRELDPEIDVVAVQKLREVTLRVVVSGRASAPDASLQSDPPLDPNDQLSYLAFGKPASSLGGNDAAQLQSAATQVIGQLAFADLGSEIDGLIPLDSIHVEGGSEGVGIGGNIAPGIYLRYAHDIANNDDLVGVEWQFRPRWLLRSEVKSDGNAGLDVIWSRDY